MNGMRKKFRFPNSNYKGSYDKNDNEKKVVNKCLINADVQFFSNTVTLKI